LIAGPCVVESEALVLEVAERLRDMTAALASRSSQGLLRQGQPLLRRELSRRGLEAGLKALERVRREIGVPVLTDVHEDTPLAEVSAVVMCCRRPPSSAGRRISS